ncbi:hypothetical protein [Hymenobacter sublimis]|uniref:DUF4390 domain-containing protein n=1 Tax=Hymenobacter sublimis TaxID=2933777 RepID=A0ABY4JH15_9BACT|nr:hypothetical protein [Hymenobacter sublimis]UPL51289.1 hypothetical protein MWH26_19345 [Hymenobacter sublimis]
MKPFLLFWLLVLHAVPLIAQHPARHPHRIPVGEIRFSAAAVADPGQTGAAYIGLRTYPLHPHSQLFLTAFLNAPLVRALQRAAPHVPVQALARTGTYQVGFYVDAHLVYLANLSPGTFTPAAKSTETVLQQALLGPENGESADNWGPLLWDRFLANGGARALAVGQHLLRLEIRPYYQDPGLRGAPLLAAGQVALDVTAPLAPRRPLR